MSSLITRELQREAPRVQPVRAREGPAGTQHRLQVARVLSTFTLFGLTVRTIHTYVPDFIDKLPWP